MTKVNKIKLSSGNADADGNAAAYSDVIRGKILKIELVYDSGMADTCKTAIMSEKL